MSKNIVICADDFAQNPAISNGIIQLIEAKRISATSCMTNSPYWPEQGLRLKDQNFNVAIGLHINLTEGSGLDVVKRLTKTNKELPGLTKILSLAVLNKLDKLAIAMEIERQIDKFVDVTKRQPDFIDGHQHIHHFSVIRDALADVYRKKFTSDQKPWVRSLANIKVSQYAKLKSFVINKTGANDLLKWLNADKIPYNDSFTGIYNFASAIKFSDFFKEFLNHIGDQGLIMCHPGLESEFKDTLNKSRYLELEYLMSNSYLDDLNQFDIKLITQFN